MSSCLQIVHDFVYFTGCMPAWKHGKHKCRLTHLSCKTNFCKHWTALSGNQGHGLLLSSLYCCLCIICCPTTRCTDMSMFHVSYIHTLKCCLFISISIQFLQRAIHEKGDISLVLAIVSFICCFFSTMCVYSVSMLCHIPAMLLAAKVWGMNEACTAHHTYLLNSCIA